jgi:hypothetical protein
LQVVASLLRRSGELSETRVLVLPSHCSVSPTESEAVLEMLLQRYPLISQPVEGLPREDILRRAVDRPHEDDTEKDPVEDSVFVS